jgi:hypothetical protein
MQTRKNRVDHPAFVTLLVLTDADTGRRIAVNSGWFTTLTEGDKRGTAIKFMNGDVVTVEEDFATILKAFMPR